MIDKYEILRVARSFNLQPSIIEKDYVLGWLLMGIQANGRCQEKWTFKGGTCLKKCFFNNYRFSEDLDFTVSDESLIEESMSKWILKEVSEWDNMLRHQLSDLKPFEHFWDQLKSIFEWVYT